MRSLLLASLVATTSLPALAQTAETGLTFGGTVELEYLDADTIHLWAFDGDMSASWRSGGLLGFDAALDTTYLEDGSELTNVWAALVLSTDIGEFAVGAPRPVVDRFKVMPDFSSSSVLDLDIGLLTSNYTALASGFDNGMTPGLTYVGTSGNLTYGGGYHQISDEFESIDVLEGAMTYAAAGTTYFINGEFVDGSDGSYTLMRIGALHDADRFDIGAALSQLRIPDTRHTLRLYGSVDVIDSLSLTGDLLMVEDSSDLYSLSARYEMPNGLFVEGGGIKIQDGPEIYDIGVGFKF